MKITDYSILESLTFDKLNFEISNQNVLINLETLNIKNVKELIEHFDSNNIFVKNLKTLKPESIKEITNRLDLDTIYIKDSTEVQISTLELIGIIELIKHTYLDESLPTEKYLSEKIGDKPYEIECKLRRMGFTRDEYLLIKNIVNKKNLSDKTYAECFERIVNILYKMREIRINLINKLLFLTNYYLDLKYENKDLPDNQKILRNENTNDLLASLDFNLTEKIGTDTNRIRTNLTAMGFDKKQSAIIEKIINNRDFSKKKYIGCFSLIVKDLQKSEEKRLKLINKLSIFINYTKQKENKHILKSDILESKNILPSLTNENTQEKINNYEKEEIPRKKR